MGDMLRAQESYSPDAKRRRSGRLVPADGPTITSSGNICAATRQPIFQGIARNLLTEEHLEHQMLVKV